MLPSEGVCPRCVGDASALAPEGLHYQLLLVARLAAGQAHDLPLADVALHRVGRVRAVVEDVRPVVGPDRAALGKTWIKRGVKTDNLVQIGHNVVIGEDTIIVAQVGISGSVRVGREVIMGGQVGISDHLEIGDRVMIGAQSGVAKSVPAGEVVSGTPALPHRLWLKASGLLKKLPRMNERLRHLEKKVTDLERKMREGKDS